MKLNLSRRLRQIPPYAFAEMGRTVAKLRAEGVDVIDLGVGDPVRPAPEVAVEAMKSGIAKYATSGYPPYEGTQEMRAAAADYMKRMFGVKLDPDSEVLVTDGSKEAVFHLPEGLVDPGDVVLAPSPGYIPYYRGASFAEGRCVVFPLEAKNGFLPDLAALDRMMTPSVRLLWLCYPNAPTGALASKEFYDRVIGMARQRGVVVASDEAYADFVWDGEAVSALQSGKEGVIAFYSLSKRSNMTGYRVGWACGDPEIVGALGKVKVNLDSGTPCFVQAAAAAALGDEAHIDAMRSEYRRNMETLTAALEAAGLASARPRGALYVWQKGPGAMSSAELCKRLLEPDVAVAALPGEALAPELEDGSSPGDGYVRFSLTALPERVELAAERIRKSLRLG
jgi:LL-diaminopimelate aminotransferase